MRHSIPIVVFSLMCTSAHKTATGNPVGKVIDLLEKLKKEISEEGQDEAKAYDKFACFCKEQADDKLYAITKSKEKIELLVSQIKELDAQITELDEAVKKDKEKKEELEKEGKEKAEERSKALKKYEEKEKDMSTALKAIKDAIAALKESKDKMKDAKLSMVAHKSVSTTSTATSTSTTTASIAISTTTITTSTLTTTTTSTSTSSRLVSNGTKKTLNATATDANKTPPVSAMETEKEHLHDIQEKEKDHELIAARRQIAELKAQLAKTQEKAYDGTEKAASTAVKKVLALLDGFEPGKPAPYEYGSNDIIETLQTLFKQFRDNKYKLDNEEQTENQEYEMEKGARDMQIKFTTELIEKNTELSAEKSKKKADLETDRDDEKDMKEKDGKFMEDLTEKCEDKAKGWDERSKTRSAEITAITEAIATLKSGVQPNYNLLDVNSKEDDTDHDEEEADNDDVSFIDDEIMDGNGFLQLRSSVKRHIGRKKHGARKAVLKFLTARAGKLNSKNLALIVQQLSFSADHFAKIRELIKDLIQEIKDGMKAEEKKKEFCDKELGKAVDRRDELLAKTEEEANNIGGAKARLIKLNEDITECELQIAELYKSLNEATEIRDEEKADNEKALKDGKAGLKAVKQAIKVLKEFYEGFLQLQKAPGGRDGKSVEDLAPEAETGEYKGKTDKGKGIIDLLEVIEGDFEREVEDTEKAEEKSESDYEEQKSTIEDDIKALKKDGKDKKDESEKEEADLVGFEEELKDAKTDLADAKDELSKLRPQCVDLGLTFKARQARSKEEIKALKEALEILKKYAD